MCICCLLNVLLIMMIPWTHSGLLAAGTYSHTIALFAPDQPVNSGAAVALLGQEEQEQGQVYHQGGITLVKWSTCGNYIFTGKQQINGLMDS